MTTDQLLQLATKHHRAGDLAEAQRLYVKVLADDPAHAPALFQIGLLELQNGRPDASLAAISQAVAASPDEPRYRFGLGKALTAMHQWLEAAAAFRRVLQTDPESADAHFDLGVALESQGDYAEAIIAYRSAVQFRPRFADALNNLGNCLQRQGDFVQAEAAYRQSLEVRPRYPGAMSNLGTVLQETGRPQEAIALFRDAVLLEPDAPQHAVNLGAALCQQRNFDEAESVLRRVIDRNEKNAEAAYNLGNALQGLGRTRDAAAQYQRAKALRPDYVDASINLGNVRKELGEFDLATSAYEAALGAQPASVVALNNFSCLLRTLGRLEEAKRLLRRGLELNARHAVLYNNLGNVLKDSGELDEAIDCFRRALELDPTDAPAHSNLCYSLSFQATEGQAILEECLRYNARHAAPLRREACGHANARLSDRRVRIGYVSPDFRDHCQSLFTIPLLSNHDHAEFEIFCYSSVERPDEITRRVTGYADVWREVRRLDDSALCEFIRADRIDILVDLTMHMADGRPLMFARRPAPVQIAWLAYPGTTGLDSMNYRFSDARLDPPGFDDYYSERTIRLPDSFWCYDPLTNRPEVNTLPALTRGYLTLGCLNNPCKLSDRTLALWSGVLRALPDSRLVLMAPPGSHRQRVRERLSARGVAEDRIDFLPYRPRCQYLRSYHDIDLGLDTVPYNGHTTSLDSFWMGVPVITRVGETCVGRGGLSQLFHLDLLELAAESDEAFVEAAVALGGDLPRLAALRENLRSMLEGSALMDGDHFARNIEAVYRRIRV